MQSERKAFNGVVVCGGCKRQRGNAMWREICLGDKALLNSSSKRVPERDYNSNNIKYDGGYVV